MQQRDGVSDGGIGCKRTATREAARGRLVGAGLRRTSWLVRTAAIATLAIALLGMAVGPTLAAGETALEPKPVNTEAPKLTGTPKVGQTLSCSQGGWTNNPSGYTYTWLRSGRPIAGQTASAYTVQSADQGHSVTCQVTASNSGGEYTITGLFNGSYKVQFSSSEGGNYEPQWYNGKSLNGEAAAVPVTAPNLTLGVNAALSAGGQISGRVTAASGGAALAGIEVCVGETGFGLFGLFGNCASTNGNGEYTIQSLPSGTYSVTFSAFACGEISCTQQNYLSQSEPGVAVTAGGAPATVNAALSSGGLISGRVTAASGGAALAGIEVCASETSGELFGNCASTNAGGEYTISGLPSGASYIVGFSRGREGGNYAPQWYNGMPSKTGATPVAVIAGSTTPNIDAALATGGQIAGKVTAASGGAALANITACTSGEFEFIGNCASTNVGGEYTVKGLPAGTYKVTFLAVACGEIGCTQQNYLSQSERGVVVAAGSTTPNIDAALATSGQITGKVTAASGGAALANVGVCFGGPVSGCASTSTNASGEYTIPGLPSGVYNVSFMPSHEGGSYLPNFVSSVVVTAPNTTSGIDAALPPGGQISGRVTAASGGASLANIEVCANSGPVEGCAITNGGGGSTSAASNALSVTASAITLAKTVFDAKTGELDFYFQFVEPGTLRWSLYFKNADVGFADSLGLSRLVGGLAGADPAVLETAVAETARRKSRHKSKKCKTGEIKHRGRCALTLVLFAAGSKSVTAGAVEIEVHPDAKAVKALRAGHTLHVSGQFTFQSALGGLPVSHTVSIAVHEHSKKRKGKGKGGRKK
ncbi:MAG: carboxypeptidase regulatory-like domain-containing protein [Solirubrobacterales bacterium]